MSKSGDPIAEVLRTDNAYNPTWAQAFGAKARSIKIGMIEGAEQAITRARGETAITKIDMYADVTIAAMEGRDIQRTAQARSTIDSLPAAAQAKAIAAETARAEAMADWDRANAQRPSARVQRQIQGVAPPDRMLGAGSRAYGYSTPLAPSLSTEELEATALKALMRTAGMPPAQADAEIASWIDDMRRTLGDNVATELSVQVQTLRAKARS